MEEIRCDNEMEPWCSETESLRIPDAVERNNLYPETPQGTVENSLQLSVEVGHSSAVQHLLCTCEVLGSVSCGWKALGGLFCYCLEFFILHCLENIWDLVWNKETKCKCYEWINEWKFSRILSFGLFQHTAKCFHSFSAEAIDAGTDKGSVKLDLRDIDLKRLSLEIERER